MAIRTGTQVKWKWGSSWAEGKVSEVHHDEVSRTTKGEKITRKGSEVHHDEVSRTTKGEKITRKGSDDDPAYVIEQEDGTVVLKLRSEVEQV